MYSQTVNTLDELKARITAKTTNVTKDMLQLAGKLVLCGTWIKWLGVRSFDQEMEGKII
jgi:hypothetical protein